MSKKEANKFDENWKSIDSRKIPQWFTDAKFGIFIHWGVYSVPAWRKTQEGLYASYAEWYYARVMYNQENDGEAFHHKNYGKDFQYRDFAPLFKAELFDAEHWAKLFKESGAKYVVLTAKHHDGYCLWPSKSKYSKNWNSVDVGPNKDLVGEISDAVKNQGLEMGLYYSMIEWESTWTNRTPSGYFLPDFIIKKHQIPSDLYISEHLMPHLKELVEQYEPNLIFTDGGEWDFEEEYSQTKSFLTWLYNESKVKDKVVVNDRFFKGMPCNHGDYYSSEYGDAQNLIKDHPWEENRGMGGSYGYNRAEHLEHYKTTQELIVELIDIVSRGGNLLLNVGPTADGRIPLLMQERLIQIGKWLQVNGEGIYDTFKHIRSSQKEKNNLYFTCKKNTLYCFFTSWHKKILLEDFGSKKIEAVELLGIKKVLKWNIKNGFLEISIPLLTVDQIPCLHAWCIKITYSK